MTLARDPRPSLSRLGIPRRHLLAAGIAGALAPAVGTRAASALSGKLHIGLEETNGALVGLAQQTADAINAEFPDARVEVEVAAAGSFQTQLFLALASGRAPDVFAVSGLGIGELSAAGLLAPLDGYLAGWDGWAQYQPAAVEGVTFQGNVWALPYGLDTHFLYYRRDIFERAGLPRDWAPTHPDEILAAAMQIKAADAAPIPYVLHAGANGGTSSAIRGLLPLIYAYGGWMTNAEGKWIIDSCPLRNALSYYERAYQIDRVVPEDVMTSANPQDRMRQAFIAGETPLILEGSWVYSDWERMDAAVAASEIGWCQFPRADGQPPFSLGGVGVCWYLNARTEQPDLAWEFMRRMNTKEAHVALNLDSAHIPARMDAAADPAITSSTFLEAVVATGSSLVVGPPDPQYRVLLGVIQNVTGLVATGEATPEEALQRYADELERQLGAENVVAEPCG